MRASIHRSLRHLGLQAAVESLADGFPIPVRLDVTDRRLQSALEESVYFFVCEALTNVIEHSEASAAAIQIATGSMLLTVEVSDNGIGGAALGSGGGLVGLLDRVHALSGEFTVASPPTGGTVLRAAIPLPAEPV
jgi:signal transduction histidine kinase